MKNQPAQKEKQDSENKFLRELEKLASDEQEKVAKEILERTNEESEEKKVLTIPSASAVNTALQESGYELSTVKKTPKQLFILYLTNQFVARAVNVRADTLISRGYRIVGKDAVGIDECRKLIEASGGINVFWNLSVSTDISGDGFVEKIYSVDKKKILRLKPIHPVTFGFKKDQMAGKILVDKQGNPVGYEQISWDSTGKQISIDVPKEVISHLRFNTLGDDFTGISLLQPGYNTIVRLMNMEYSAAEAAIKTANPLIVVKCNTKSPHQVALWAKILGSLNGKDQIFVPEGMELDLKSPGNQNFGDYSKYFLDAVVSCTSVPKSILLGGDSGGSNRAEGVILSRHFYSVIRCNQRYMQEFFNSIFIEFAELAGFEAPTLVFDDIAEDATLTSQSAIELFDSGIINVQEARQMIGLDPVGITGDGEIPEKGPLQNVAQDLKKVQSEVQFPSGPGRVSGSQAGIKKRMKTDPYSLVEPSTQ